MPNTQQDENGISFLPAQADITSFAPNPVQQSQPKMPKFTPPQQAPEPQEQQPQQAPTQAPPGGVPQTDENGISFVPDQPVPPIKKEPDTSSMKDYIEKNLQSIEHIPGDFMSGLDAGFQRSFTGLVGRGKLPDAVDPQHAGLAFDIASSIGQLGGDIPTIAAGLTGGALVGATTGAVGGSAIAAIPGAAAGAVLGASVGGTSGAFAVPSAVRKMLMDHYEKGDITSPRDFVSRLMGAAWEGIKGGTVGAATAITGGAAGLAAEGAAGVAAKYGAPAIAKGIAAMAPMAALAGELGAMTTVGAAVEGHLPHAQDFLTGAIVLAGVHGISSATDPIATKLRNIYSETGATPDQVVSNAQSDVQLKQDLLSPDKNLPAEAKDTELQHFSQKEGSIPSTEDQKASLEKGQDPEIPEPDKHWDLVPKEDKLVEETPPADITRTDAENRVLSTIVDRPGKAEAPFKEKLSKGIDSLTVAIKDDLNPIKQLVDQSDDNGQLEPSKNPYMLARNFRDVSGKIYRTLAHDTFSFDDNNSSSGEGLLPILKDIPDKDVDGLDAYLKSRRVLADPKMREQGISLDDAKQVVVNGKARFEAIAKRLDAYQDSLKQYAVDSGILSREKSDLFDETSKAYAPLYKVLDVDPLTGKGAGNKSLFQKMTGSDKQSISSIQGIFENTAAIIKAAEENRIKTAIIRLPEIVKNGLARKIPADMMGIHVTAEELEQASFNDYKDQIRHFLPDASSADIKKAYNGENVPEFKDLTIFKRAPVRLADNEMVVKVNGKAETWALQSDVAEAVKAMNYNPQFTSLWAKMFAAPFKLATKALRVGILGDPGFALRHGIRSGAIAEIQSQYPGVPLVETFHAMGDIFNHSDDYWKFVSSGGALGSMDKLKTLMDDKSWQADTKDPLLKNAWNAITSPLKLAETMTQLADLAPRMAEFKKSGALEGDLNTQVKGAFDARNVSVDYMRQGALTKMISFAQPFLNVDMQGTFRALEGLKDPKLIAKALAIITLPEIVNFMINKDDQRYKNAPLWEHGAFTVIPIDHWVPGTHAQAMSSLEGMSRQKEDGSWEINNGLTVRIPRFFTLGMMFGSMPHMILDSYYNHNPRAFDNLGQQIMKSISPAGLTTLGQPMVEQASNHNFFSGSPLVSDQVSKQLPQFQYQPYTSEVAKQVGKVIGHLPQIGPDDAPLASPIVIDNYIRSWGGTLGGYVVNMLDKGLHEVGVGKQTESAATNFTEYPIIKEFFSHFPSTKAQSIMDFKNNFGEIQKTYSTIQSLQKQASTGDQNAMTNANKLMQGFNPALAGQLGEIHQAITEGGKALNMINENPKMSPADKRQLMDTITFQMMGAAERGNKIFNQAKH